MTTGTLLDHYRLGRILGVGGFATVYEANDERFESPVAVKVLAENHAMNFDIRERFLAEAQLQRRLTGAGVVAVHDLGETDRRQPFTVMALADGGDLRTRVDKLREEGVEPTEADAVAVAASLARSVGSLHSRGIVHRDLKPSNLLIFSGQANTGGKMPVLGPSEFLLLADLGFAKDISSASGLTVAGGTPGFRPPEQERVGQIDRRADVYGLSAVVYWLLTGRSVPADGDADGDKVTSDLTSAGASKPFANVIAVGLSGDPDDRQPSVEQWLDEVKAAHGAKGLRAGRPFRRRRRRRPWWQRVLVGAGSLLLVGGTLVGGLVVGWMANDRFQVDEPAGATTSVEQLANGQVLHRGQLEDMTVTIIGPATVEVDETIRFVTSITGGQSYAWLGPDGNLYEGRQLFAVTGRRPGTDEVSVLATTPAGRSLTVTAEFTVVEGQ